MTGTEHGAIEERPQTDVWSSMTGTEHRAIEEWL